MCIWLGRHLCIFCFFYHCSFFFLSYLLREWEKEKTRDECGWDSAGRQSSQHPPIFFLPSASDDSESSFFLLFLGRIEFGRWCMDPNDRLWPEKSLGFDLVCRLTCFLAGQRGYIWHWLTAEWDILAIVALAGLLCIWWTDWLPGGGLRGKGEERR